MRQLLEKIRHSQFYKEHLKQLPVTQALLKVRDKGKNVVGYLQEKADPSRKRENLLVLLQKHFYSWNSFDAECGRQDHMESPVDVIVPIYNGYEYLVKLLPELLRTKMQVTYILIDDNSTDGRILPLLQQFAQQHHSVILLQNEQNLGFVGTVNRGLEASTHHVALVNTDTELPEKWLERLMSPILEDNTVASTTPFTNSGTIFSFPEFVQNNAIYEGMCEEDVDAVFSHVRPMYQNVPTGMGFCMGMNRKALDEIGGLDQKAFGRGFGEENDWCLRAKAKGYHDVQVENLFVYHKHGGSFASAEKEKLIADHMNILYQRYPMYEHDVTKYVKEDPQKQLRLLIQLLLNCHSKKTILYVINDWGGGSERYFSMQREKQIQKGKGVFSLCYSKQKGYYELDYADQHLEQKYYVERVIDLAALSKWFSLEEIIINQLTLYPQLEQTLQDIIEVKKAHQAKLTMLFHDYYAICPSYNLTQKDGSFCKDEIGTKCQKCYEEWMFAKQMGCDSVNQWRMWWKALLEQCDEVRCFSQDTLKRVKNVYGCDLAYTLVPHQVDYLCQIDKRAKTTNVLNIGILGGLSAHKGGRVVQQMLCEVEKQQLPARIVLVGYPDGIKLQQSEKLIVTGAYEATELPALVYQYDVDIVFIPSIWPETFSYTAEEAMQMHLPLVSFDLGAPAERIACYDRGMTIPLESNIKEWLPQVYRWGVEQTASHKVGSKEVVYVSEYKSFSSRYRLLHMAEEMIVQGVAARVYEEVYPKQIDWNQVDALCVYRCRYRGRIKQMMQEAKQYHIPIIYDIDDAIFDYEHMDYVPDIDKNVYGDFKTYSAELLECMRQADRITVSTDCLKKAVERCLPNKPVFVNRNVASMQMQGISRSIYEARKNRRVDGKIILGYFSGSNTHNGDFALVAATILEIMKKYPHVYLKIGGCLELPREYDMMSDRIVRKDMVPWQRLPEEIAKTDINLMPLEDTFFHKCKSENKWMEAAFVGVPTIATYNEEIAGATSDGKDIVLCHNLEEWHDELEKLICDANYRNKIADCAHDTVLQQKTTQSVRGELVDFVLGI